MKKESKSENRIAFSYIRMSTETQLRGNSLQRQLTLTREYAKEKGFHLVEDLQDIGLSAYSGKNVKNGKLGGFLEALKNGEIDKNSVLLVESLDRLSRKEPIEAFNQFNEIISYGLEVHTLFDRQVYSKATMSENYGQLFLSIGMMIKAFAESEDKSKRISKAWETKRNSINSSNSKIYTSICPGWLKPKDNKMGFIEIPDRCKTVQKIFDLCINEDMGTFAITRFLNSNLADHPPFNTKKKRKTSPAGYVGWHKSYVTKILSNPAVHGEFTPHKMSEGKRQAGEEVFEDYFPAVVSKSTFLLAQDKLRSRALKRGGRKGTVFNNIFTKLIFCGSCKGAVHFQNKGPLPKGRNYLRCSNALHGSTCSCTSWNYDEFEESFFKFVSEVEFETLLTGGSDKAKIVQLNEEKQALAESIRIQNAKFEKLMDFENDLSGLAIDKIKSKLAALGQDIEELEKKHKLIEIEIAGLQNRMTSKVRRELLQDIKQLQETLTETEKASLRRKMHARINTVVEKIIMYNFNSVVYPWDVVSLLSPSVIKFIKSHKLTKDDKLIADLHSDKATHIYDQMERYFIVFFKNGEQRKIHPYLDNSWKTDNRRYREFVAKIEKKNALNALNNNPKYKSRITKTASSTSGSGAKRKRKKDNSDSST